MGLFRRKAADYPELEVNDHANEPDPELLARAQGKARRWKENSYYEGQDLYYGQGTPTQRQRREEEIAAIRWQQDGAEVPEHSGDRKRLSWLNNHHKLAEKIDFESLEERRLFAEAAADHFVERLLHPSDKKKEILPEQAARVADFREVIVEVLNHHDHQGDYALKLDSPHQRNQAAGYMSIAEAYGVLSALTDNPQAQWQDPAKPERVLALLDAYTARRLQGLDYGAETRQEFHLEDFAKDFLADHPYNALVGPAEYRPNAEDWQELRTAFQEQTFYSAAHYQEAVNDLATAIMGQDYGPESPRAETPKEHALQYLHQCMTNYLTSGPDQEQYAYSALETAKALAELWPAAGLPETEDQYDFLQRIGEESPELMAHGLALLQTQSYFGDLSWMGRPHAHCLRLEQDPEAGWQVKIHYPSEAEGEESFRKLRGKPRLYEIERSLQRGFDRCLQALENQDPEAFAGYLYSRWWKRPASSPAP